MIRKLFASALCFVCLGAVQVFARSETFADEKIIVTSVTATGFTAALLAQQSQSEPPCEAAVSVEGQSIRFRVTGSAATNAFGHLVTAGTGFRIDSLSDMRAFSAIGQVATSTITVSYGRGCRP